MAAKDASNPVVFDEPSGIRLSVDERRLLEALAELDGLSPADVRRLLEPPESVPARPPSVPLRKTRV